MEERIQSSLNSEETKRLTEFKNLYKEIIVKAGNDWNFNKYGQAELCTKLKDYSLEEVQAIINGSSLESQRKLSRNYYLKDGFYRRLMIYYATLLSYAGLLIPHPSFGKHLSTPHINKRYYQALEFINNTNLQELLTRFSLNAVIDGCYYGLIQSVDKKQLVLLDLPATYCRSLFKDFYGNDIVEFNVMYFEQIIDEDDRKAALKVFPKYISSYYYSWKNNNKATSWMRLPIESSICFSLSEDSRPMFLNIISASIAYDDSVETERERQLNELKKILVQHVPHLNDGQLVFEPPEALEMHKGTVNMLKEDKTTDVITSYADVSAIQSNYNDSQANNMLEKMSQNIYSQAGTSSLLFAPTTNQSLKKAIQNDIAMMMILGNKYSRVITRIINDMFSNTNITFKFEILPISIYTNEDYVDAAQKLATSGYSLLLPAVAMGLNQQDLIDIKELENEVLKLTSDVLIPPHTSYTESANSNNDDVGGRPELDLENKAEQTIKNDNSIDGGGKD